MDHQRAKFYLVVIGLLILPLSTLLFKAVEMADSPIDELRAPAGDRFTKINPSGETVLPNGRLITPRGIQVRVAPHPYGLALSPNGKTLVTASSGTWPFAISIITELSSVRPKVVQIPSGYPSKNSETEPNSVYLGLAVGPDNKTLYVSEGDNGRVGVFDLDSRQRLSSISLDVPFQGKNYTHSLTGELKLSPDGNRLYVLDLAHFRLVVIDTQAKGVISSVPVGRFPFGLALSPDGKRAYVSNVGMFKYSLVPGYDPDHSRQTGLDFPVFGFPSKEAEEGTTVGGKDIPGLGDPNVPESNSLWFVDLADVDQLPVAAKIKTGLPVGKDSVGGSSPGAVVAGKDKIFVSNAAQDSIDVIDARTLSVVKTVLLEPARAVRGLRGVLPFGMALSQDETRLYIACAGINAIAVLDAREAKALGYIPTAWFPARVAASSDGKTLYVSNAKGFGAGPNGGPDFHLGPEGTYIGDIIKSTVSVLPVPATQELEKETRTVLENNGFVPSKVRDRKNAEFPVPPHGQASDKIRHVVFITKENRTFDQVFGDVPSVGGERVEANRTLASFSDDGIAKDAETPETIEHVRVTPNHHALARRFAFSDNFYVDSDVSVDGHHWLVGNYPNEVIETAWPASYGERLHSYPDPAAPGRLELGGASPRPEDYVQAGSLWHHLARHAISFRNFGEGLDLPGSKEGEGLYPTGVRESLNVPMPEVLFENTSRSYPMFNTSISDQYRVAQFEHEFQVRYIVGKEPLPQFMYIWLPNDHTATPRPQDGYAHRASYVADNDLALGKLVELFSHSPFWRDMAIFVTEDDSQDGLDHVDAHRSLLLVISPYARRGVSHVHASMQSILKTFDLIFGVPFLNQYDAATNDLSDCFTDKPDFSPYKALPSDTRIFDPEKVREPGLELRARPTPSEPLDDPATIRRLHRQRVEDDD